jgi:hypothetical protein
MKAYDSGWVWLLIIVAVIVYFGGLFDSKWWWYSFDRSISKEKITIESKPHDCEFLTAPVGRKNCHYRKVIQTVEWSKSKSGEPIISFDAGKSWAPFTPDPGAKVPQYPQVERLIVSWERLTD